MAHMLRAAHSKCCQSCSSPPPFFFETRTLLCSFGCLRAVFVDQADLRLVVICLSFLRAGFMGISHISIFFFLLNYIYLFIYVEAHAIVYVCGGQEAKLGRVGFFPFTICSLETEFRLSGMAATILTTE